jgi:hypothetical protein
VGWFIPIATMAGSVLQASASAQQGENEAAAARYNAKLSEEEGYDEERRIRLEGSRLLAHRRQASRKAGFEPAEGTSLDALVNDAEMIERAALGARRTGISEARLLRATGRSAVRSGNLAAAGTVLAGIGNAGATAYGLRYPTGAPLGTGAPRVVPPGSRVVPPRVYTQPVPPYIRPRQA